MMTRSLEITEPLATIRIDAVSGVPHLAWAQGLCFRCPHSFVSRSESLIARHDVVPFHLNPELPRPHRWQADEFKLRAAFTDQPPVSTRLGFSYQKVPAWLRSLLASLMGRWHRRNQHRWADFPTWPLDLSSDLLDDWSSGIPSVWTRRPTPVVLSHDLDSPEGLRTLVTAFLDVEEKLGARSTNFVVPCAWPIDRGLLREVHERGHEIGIHGYDHSNRTAFAPEEELNERVARGASVGRPYEARGYRAPSLLRTRALLNHLADHYTYDSSIPTSGGLFPTPNNGCASARPFLLSGLIELPLSLPRDGSLLFLGYRPQEIVKLWLACAEQIHWSGGVVVLLTHCEERFSGQPAMRAAYRTFLDEIAADSRFRWSTAWEVVQEVTQSLADRSCAVA